MLKDRTPLPRAMLFDMDGTLTEPMLDFPTIKAEMAIGERPILEALQEMHAERRAVCEAILLRHEEQAARQSTLNAGCLELLQWVRELGIATAMITRNSRLSLETVCRKHELAMDVLITREDGRFKPDPHPLLVACERLGVSPAEAWMIGDGRYDVEAAGAAGIRSVWVSHGSPPAFDAEPWRVVANLIELLQMLKGCG